MTTTPMVMVSDNSMCCTGIGSRATKEYHVEEDFPFVNERVNRDAPNSKNYESSRYAL